MYINFLTANNTLILCLLSYCELECGEGRKGHSALHKDICQYRCRRFRNELKTRQSTNLFLAFVDKFVSEVVLFRLLEEPLTVSVVCLYTDKLL